MTINKWEFDYLCQLVRKHSGIVLESGKEYLVETRLRSLCAKTEGISTITDLVSLLRSSPRHPLIHEVVDAMTTNETLFFRDETAFDTLRDMIFPELIKARRAHKSLEIWCGASSSGQEPYSVLMLLDDAFPEVSSWDVRLLATDISPTMLDRTREARYSRLEVSRGLPRRLKDKYFDPDGDGFRVSSRLRNAVELKQLNLTAPWPRLGEFDLILMRNVLIYFDVPTKKSILERARRLMRPHGCMLLGGGETTLGVDDGFTQYKRGRSNVYYHRHGGPKHEKKTA